MGFEEKQQCPTNPLSKIIFGSCVFQALNVSVIFRSVINYRYTCVEVSSEYFLKQDDGLWHPIRVLIKQLQLVIRPHQWINCNYYRNFLLLEEHKCLSLFYQFIYRWHLGCHSPCLTKCKPCCKVQYIVLKQWTEENKSSGELTFTVFITMSQSFVYLKIIVNVRNISKNGKVRR